MYKIYGVIYKATDPFGKCYLGKHIGDGSDIGITYFGSGTYFKNTRKKYGKDYFTYLIVEKCYSKEQLNEMEKYYIKFFQARINGYNLTDGGDGASPGIKLSDDHKKKLSIARQGRNPFVNRSENDMKETINKISESNKRASAKPEVQKKRSESQKIAQNRLETRKKHSESAKIAQNNPVLKKKKAENWVNKSDVEKTEISRKMSVSLTGLKRSEETKKKMSNSHTGLKHSEETKKKITNSRNATFDKLQQSVLGTRMNHVRHHNCNTIKLSCDCCREEENEFNGC